MHPLHPNDNHFLEDKNETNHYSRFVARVFQDFCDVLAGRRSGNKFERESIYRVCGLRMPSADGAKK